MTPQILRALPDAVLVRLHQSGTLERVEAVSQRRPTSDLVLTLKNPSARQKWHCLGSDLGFILAEETPLT